jgi:Flp pilus assembly protein TadG
MGPDRGAAAVEFALILPLLLLLVFGIVEFGLLLNKQVSVSNAAREGARYMAIHYSESGAEANAATAARAAAPTVDFTGSTVAISGSACSPGALGYATATVNVAPGLVTGWFTALFDSGFMVTGEGRMICGG